MQDRLESRGPRTTCGRPSGPVGPRPPPHVGGPRACSPTTTLSLALACRSSARPTGTSRSRPTRSIGNVYYVGSKDLASYLITTPEGHILINSGFERTVPLIQKSVESLGFKMTRRQDPAGQPCPLRPRRRPRPAAGADRRQGLRHARRRPGHRLGRQGPVPLHRQPLEALQGRPRPGGRRRGQARRRHAGRPPDARPHAGLHHLDLAGRGRRQDLRRRRHRQPQRQPRLPAGRQQGLPRDRRRLRQDLPRSSRRCPATCSSAPTAATTAWSRSTSALKRGAGTNPFVDPEGYRDYVAQKEKAFRDTLAAQRGAKPAGRPGETPHRPASHRSGRPGSSPRPGHPGGGTGRTLRPGSRRGNALVTLSARW